MKARPRRSLNLFATTEPYEEQNHVVERFIDHRIFMPELRNTTGDSTYETWN